MSLQKGLVGHWTMDDSDTSGGTLYDSSARGFHGSLTAESNAPTTSQSSVLGEAYDFSSGDNITFSTNPDFPSVWTLTCWIKPQNVANGNWNTLCRGNDHQVILERNTGELGMYDNSTGNSFQGSGYDGTQLEGIWSHMAVIGSGGTQDYYIDGSFVGSAATQSTTNLNQIGYTGGQSWGLMSNFRLYHRALSESEISALYNMRSQRQHNSKTVLDESFADGSFGDRWSVSNATISSTRSYEGANSFGSWNEGGVEATMTVQEAGNERIDSFEYYWKEDNSQTGHVVILLDKDGNEIQESGTENYQWLLNDGAGGRFEVAGNVSNGGYNNWTRFTFDFDWENGQYSYDMEDLEEGHRETGTTALDNSTGVKEIRFTGAGYGTADWNRFDHISINV